MARTSFFGSALLSVLLIGACSKAADEQEKAVNAQTEANTKIIEASKEADQKVRNAQTEANTKIVEATNQADQKARNAQAEADQKIADARANFLKMCEDYRHEVANYLVDLDKKVAELEAKEQKASAKTQAEIKAKLHRIHESRQAFEEDLKTLENETADTWDSAKARLDRKWEELKAHVEKP